MHFAFSIERIFNSMKYIKTIIKINKRCYALKMKQDDQYRVLFAVLNQQHKKTRWKIGGTLKHTAGEFFNEMNIHFGCAYNLTIQIEILKEFKQLKSRI